jgi:hypothetical protein
MGIPFMNNRRSLNGKLIDYLISIVSRGFKINVVDMKHKFAGFISL